MDSWNPVDPTVPNNTRPMVAVRGDVTFKPGDQVRLRPLGRADVMDIALDGKIATIVSIEEDFENRIYLAVTVDEDPGNDLGAAGQIGHRFFFGIEEVEPIGSTEKSRD
jgi:hypothetical protein